jgi:hypothetical protein
MHTVLLNSDPRGMRRPKWILALLATALSLVAAGPAAAAGGNALFDGGTPRQQAQVRSALGASAFDFNRLPVVTVHIKPGIQTQSQPGHVWLDARLLDAGRFSWATVQDEFAHQVDFLLLDDVKRAVLNTALGGKDWCYGVAGLGHSAYGCERFSSVFAWAFWPAADNPYKPSSAKDESAAMPPAKFRALLGSLLGFADPLGGRGTAASQRQSLSRK